MAGITTALFYEIIPHLAAPPRATHWSGYSKVPSLKQECKSVATAIGPGTDASVQR